MWLWRVMCVLVLFCAELHLFVLPIYPVVFPLFCSCQSSAGAICQTAYRWRPGLFSCWTHHMEEPAGQCHLCSISVNLPSASENISVLGFLPWHYHWWPVAYSPILSGFWSDLFTWTTVKIHNWLLDWLIDWLIVSRHQYERQQREKMQLEESRKQAMVAMAMVCVPVGGC